MLDDMDDEFRFFPKPRQSINPLKVNNAITSFDRKDDFQGMRSKSPQKIRKSLFMSKENDESLLCVPLRDHEFSAPSARSGSDEFKGKKPRRSMLGLRSKVRPSISNTDDNTYTISKPLYCSSPERSGEERSVGGNYLQKTVSMPSIPHPFDSNDGDSSFFVRGHCESTWSVFKNNDPKDRPKTKTALPDQTPLNHNMAPPRFKTDETTNDFIWNVNKNPTLDKDSKASKKELTYDQKQKLEQIALDFAGKAIKTTYLEDGSKKRRSSQDEKKGPVIKDILAPANTLLNGARTRAQAKKVKEMFQFKQLSPIPNETEINTSDLPQDDSRDSNDSFLKIEATVIASAKESLGGFDEEMVNDLTLKSNSSNDYDSAQEENSSAESISDMLADLKQEKDAMDSKFADFLKQKEVFDKKWTNFVSALDKSNEIINNVGKPKVSTQKKENGVSTPTLIVSKASNLNKGKKYSDRVFKTPTVLKKDIKHLRKSVCYTPKTLSNLVGQQEKDIFGNS